MKLYHNGSTYAYILSEREWYLGTAQEQEAWINEIMRKATEANATYVSLLVEPDLHLSVSPNPRQHAVFSHTFETPADERFCNALQDADANSNLSLARKRAIARRIFDL